MFQINREANNIIQLKERRFSELGFRERDHLQEWIAKNPEVVGEELLIIQKEFDGFSETNERLDLLALDKEGDVVVIENKLDDTGRDVVWQALKYASYCSTLSTSQIIKMFQSYLDRQGRSEDARTTITDFLEVEDEESMVLNRNDQRLMFIANNYRKEVTSTVLWLLDHDVRIQCFRATPYSLDEDLFLQIEQIIPVPEASEFIIDIKEKAKEDKGKSKRVEKTENELLSLWTDLKKQFKANGLPYLENVKPQPRWYFGFSKGKGRFSMVIGRTGLRVELYFHNDETKQFFDAMRCHADQIHQSFGQELEWQRLDGKKASRIKFEIAYDQLSGRDREDIKQERIDWYLKNLDPFYKAVMPYWTKVQEQLAKRP